MSLGFSASSSLDHGSFSSTGGALPASWLALLRGGGASSVPLFTVVTVSLNDLERPLACLAFELWPMTRADRRFREFIALCHRAMGAMRTLSRRALLGMGGSLTNCSQSGIDREEAGSRMTSM